MGGAAGCICGGDEVDENVNKKRGMAKELYGTFYNRGESPSQIFSSNLHGNI